MAAFSASALASIALTAAEGRRSVCPPPHDARTTSMETAAPRHLSNNSAGFGDHGFTPCLNAMLSKRGNRNGNKTESKTPDSLRREASQAASAAPTLRYGPAGDSAPRLRLKAAGMTERFPFGPSTRPEATRR